MVNRFFEEAIARYEAEYALMATKPDWRFWPGSRPVSPEEAVHLSLDHSPDVPLHFLWEKEFQQRLALVGALTGYAYVPLSQFAAILGTLTIPPELATLITPATSISPPSIVTPVVTPVTTGTSKSADAPAERGTSGDTPDGVPPTGNIGELNLRQGKNSRELVKAWVDRQARDMRKDGEIVADLAERIKLKADKWGYESERKPPTVASITRMIPPGLTGGRGKSRTRPKK